ncbi:hypothetical protein BLOT_015581 [Blomia tropicalis]|nr:hypothetical protein BLOT_015581 [Blomia tropicalis]
MAHFNSIEWKGTNEANIGLEGENRPLNPGPHFFRFVLGLPFLLNDVIVVFRIRMTIVISQNCHSTVQQWRFPLCLYK